MLVYLFPSFRLLILWIIFRLPFSLESFFLITNVSIVQSSSLFFLTRESTEDGLKTESILVGRKEWYICKCENNSKKQKYHLKIHLNFIRDSEKTIIIYIK